MTPALPVPLPGYEPPVPVSYLRPAGERRRHCAVFTLNPDWNGRLIIKSSARIFDPSTSHDAAGMVNPKDIFLVRQITDILLRAGRGVISTEIREYVLTEIRAGRLDSLGQAADVRAESLRRRFCDLCP